MKIPKRESCSEELEKKWILIRILKRTKHGLWSLAHPSVFVITNKEASTREEALAFAGKIGDDPNSYEVRSFVFDVSQILTAMRWYQNFKKLFRP